MVRGRLSAVITLVNVARGFGDGRKDQLIVNCRGPVDQKRQLFFLQVLSTGFYRAMHFSAKRGIAIACRLSVVRPSVTLVNCDHIGWNSSKIILRSVSLFALCNPNVTGLLQGEHPEIFARIGVGC